MLKSVNLFLIIGFMFSQSLNSLGQTSAKIQSIVDKTAKNPLIKGITLKVHSASDSGYYSAGNLQNSSVYFTASITKMYTAAVLFALIDEGKINIDDPISRYLDSTIVYRLHQFKTEDYSSQITLRHLLSNRSGLADYFEEKNNTGSSIKTHVISVGDTSLSFEEKIAITKSIPAHFPPGESDKAYYSDGNFQLLGRIIENVCEISIDQIYQKYIFDRLSLNSSALFSEDSKSNVCKFYYKDKEMHVPRIMASFWSDGAIISDNTDLMVFLRAFFRGKLFGVHHLSNEWFKLEGPFSYGKGLMRFKYPGTPELIGHSGASGSFAYYSPQKDAFICGTINQIHKPQLAFKLMIKIFQQL